MVTQMMIRKVLPFEVKEVSERVLEFVGSTEDRDRMGDIITASGWQLRHYKKNPVFMWAHRYDDPPVGKALKVWIEENKLKFHIQFATKEEYEFADTIYKLYKGGYLRASSVGFMSLESEPIETKEEDEGNFFRPPPTRYLKQDLLELSGCPVPANPNALAEAKTKGIISETQLTQLIEQRSAISYQSAHPNGTPKAPEDEEWEAGEEVAAAEVDDLKAMCAIVQGDADLKTSYKLPHHKAAGHMLVWRGVAAAGAVLMGARGGIDATEAEKAGAKAHLAKHYREFDKVPPWEAERDITQEQIADELDYVVTFLQGKSFNPENKEKLWEIARGIMRLHGSDIPFDITDKIRAVLNKKNRERVEQIKTITEEILSLAEPREPEPERGLTTEEVVDIVQQSVSQVIRKAQGKIK